MVEHPRKRSNPTKVREDRAEIIKDMESRLPPDTEDPESVQRRKTRTGPPRKRGAMVVGFKKNNSPV